MQDHSGNRSGDTGFQNQVVHMVEKQFIDHWRSLNPTSAEDAEYIYTYVAIGSVGVIRKWLDEDMVKPSAEIAELIIRLSGGGFSALG